MLSYAIHHENICCKFPGVCNDKWEDKDIWLKYYGPPRFMDCDDYSSKDFPGHPGHCSRGSKICTACGCNEGYEAIILIDFDILG